MGEGPTVDDVIEAADEKRRDDTRAAIELICGATGAEPQVWGASMIGFGRAPYSTADGKEHDWFAIGLSPRKAALVFYGLVGGVADDLLDGLGPHTTGKGCLYVKRLDAVDRSVLAEMVGRAWRDQHRPSAG
jgi:hypothetical protein